MTPRNLFVGIVMLSALSSPAAFAEREFGSRMLEAFPEVAPDENFLQEVQAAGINWAQPPLGCVEEMVPHRADNANHPCPDLSGVQNPMRDWPTNLSPSEKQYWVGQRRGINICRSEEVLRRERERPGSQNPAHLELAWMAMDSLRNANVKVQAIYDASRASGVPVHVLTGAVYQESLFAELGIADDGGNYSCGVEQINLIGWCTWMNKQSVADRRAMGWPASRVECSDSNLITLSFFKPLYEIAKSRLNGQPEYRLNKQHFQNIPLSSIVSKWPSASPQTQQTRYQLIMSYVNNCSDPRKGILAKANELAGIYNQFVSPAMKQKDRYPEGQHFGRACRETQADNAYPLHTGWLMAVSAYNAGPRTFDAVAYYNRWSREQMNDPRVIANFTPNDIVTSIYWSGRYNPSTDQIDFRSMGGETKSWGWFKGCVAQRHIARVMQHVTLLPDFFVDTLEGDYPCARSKMDSNGHVIQTSVPPLRQRSSGVKGQ